MWALWRWYSSKITRFVYWDRSRKGLWAETPCGQISETCCVREWMRSWTSCYKQRYLRKSRKVCLAGSLWWWCQKVMVTSESALKCVPRTKPLIVIRERHPISTEEELLHDSNGSKVFSKVDLRWRFHQTLLSGESRHIPTLGTHRGLYRYKRLRLAWHLPQRNTKKIVRDVLRGCVGVANIAETWLFMGSIWERYRWARHEAFCGAW